MMVKGKRRLVLNTKWCKGCGICVAFCPKNVLDMVHEKAHIAAEENCILCGQCELRCPDFAIYIEEEKNNG